VAKRGYVQREFKLALDTLQEMPENLIHIIPVRLDDCIIPEQFGFLHWCNLFENDGFERLVQAIQAGLTQRQPLDVRAQLEEPVAPEVTYRESFQEVNLEAQRQHESETIRQPERSQRDHNKRYRRARLYALLFAVIFIICFGLALMAFMYKTRTDNTFRSMNSSDIHQPKINVATMQDYWNDALAKLIPLLLK
jgi:hypothetical protein